jgi:mRNA interferase RelE/StbE
MTYAVLLASPARRALESELPEAVATAAVEFVFGDLAENPHRVGKALRLELTGYHVARRGTYRVVYAVDDDEKTVTIVKIQHRRDVYHR